jgi:hypothetical protein
MDALRQNPDRFGVARESRKFAYTVRELLYGLGTSVTHRALFTVWHDTVIVFSIRHVSQKDVSPDEV